MARISFYLFFIFSISSLKSQAQETMMTEISYPYLDRLIKTAVDNYPRVQSFNRQLSISADNIKRARLSWFDIFNFSYMRTTDLGFAGTSTGNNPFLFNGIFYGINFSVGTILQKPSQIKSVKEQYAITELQKQEYLLTLENTVKQRYFTYIQQSIALRLIMQTVQDTENMMKSTRNKYEKGEITFDVYNQSLIAYTSLVQQRVGAESAMLIAKANLEEIVGKKLELIYNGN